MAKSIYKYCTKCKKEWFFIPKTAELKNEGKPTDGFYFKCDCKDTLFIDIYDALAKSPNNRRIQGLVKRSFL